MDEETKIETPTEEVTETTVESTETPVVDTPEVETAEEVAGTDAE